MSSSTLNHASPAASARLILASSSRFRRQMLENAGLKFSVVAANVDEPEARAEMMRLSPAITPGQVARQLARLKALEVSRRHAHALVIGADQVLALGESIFSKPDDVPMARDQLQRLCGKTHRLETAVVFAQDGAGTWEHVETPQLTMRAFSPEFLQTYLDAVGSQVTETVGAYMLEGLGAQLFERVEGDYFSILGLPLFPVLCELRRRGLIGA